MNQSVIIPLLIVFVAVNLAPAFLYYYEIIPWSYAVYFYLGECALAGTFSLLLYGKQILVFCAVLLLATLVMSMKDQSVWHDLRVPTTFWTLYSLCWLVYFEIGKSKLGKRILNVNIVTHFLFYISFMVVAVISCFAVTAAVFNMWHLVETLPNDVYVLFLAMAAIIPTMTIGSLKIIDIIGPRHFIAFMLGTYYRPVEKKRVVLFLDMVGSSTIAEQLYPKDSMALIARFIYDASFSFRLHGGDIINYTGDGLVVLWPLKKADKAVAAVQDLNDVLRQNKASYMKQFGLVPDFRVGLHAGEIVINQIGEEKLFIGLYGDVVNTAARLEGLCKDLGVKVLLSRAVGQNMSHEGRTNLKAMGEHDIRGRAEKVHVYTLKELDL